MPAIWTEEVALELIGQYYLDNIMYYLLFSQEMIIIYFMSK